MDQLPRLGKRELICLLLFTCNYVVSVWRGFLFLWVPGMGYVIFLLWHSVSLPLIILKTISQFGLYCSQTFDCNSKNLPRTKQNGITGKVWMHSNQIMQLLYYLQGSSQNRKRVLVTPPFKTLKTLFVVDIKDVQKSWYTGLNRVHFCVLLSYATLWVKDFQGETSTL